ncbi:MAG: hypothetical protein ACREJQ_01160 [bacterium]
MQTFLRPKGVLEIVDSAAYILRRNLAPLMLLGLYNQIPFAIMSVFLNPAEFIQVSSGNPLEFVKWMLLYFLLFFSIMGFWSPLLTMAQYHASHSYVVGDRVSAGRSLDFGLKNYWKAFWTYALYGLVVGGAVFLANIGLFLFAVIGVSLGPVSIGFGFLVGLPLLLAVIGYPTIGFSLCMPALAVEGISGVEALKRAWQLAYGFREDNFESKTWVRFILLSIIYGLIAACLYVLGILPGGIIGYVWGETHDAGSKLPLGMRALAEVLALGFQVFISIFHTLIYYLLYLDIRVRYEAYDLQLATQTPVETPETPPPPEVS